MSEGTVGALVKKLRKMHGHLSAKDKTVAVECIGALTDLAVQLHNATHVETRQVPRPPRFEIRKLEETGHVVDGAHPDGTPVLEDTDGSSVR